MADTSQGGGDVGPRRSKRNLGQAASQSEAQQSKKRKPSQPARESEAPVPELDVHPNYPSGFNSNITKPPKSTAISSKSAPTIFTAEELADHQLAKVAIDGVVDRRSNRPVSASSTHVSASAPATPIDHNIEHFLNDLPDLSRGFTPELKQISTKSRNNKPLSRWMYTAHDVNGNIRYFGTELCSITSKEHAEATNRGLAHFANRWPQSLDLISYNKYKPPVGKLPWRDQFIIRAARVLELGTAHIPIRGPAPGYRMKNGHPEVVITIHAFDPVTYVPFKYTTGLGTGYVDCDTIADLPDGAMEFTYDNGRTFRGKDVKDADGTDQYESTIPGSLQGLPRTQLVLVERLARRMVYELHGKVMDVGTIKSRMIRLRELHGCTKRVTGVGLAEGGPLCYMKPDYPARRCFLCPTLAAVQAGVPESAVISSPSASAAWLANIVETMEDSYNRTGDVLTAWADAAETAEANRVAIRHGERPPSRCECAPGTMQDCETHNCATCFRGTVCSARFRSSIGFWVCRLCAAREADSIAAVTKQPFIEQFIRRKLIEDTRAEARKAGREADDSIVLQNQQDCLMWLRNTLEQQDTGINQWTSEITLQTYTLSEIGNTSDVTSYRFDDPSPDAIFPYDGNHGVSFLHTPTNLWLIELCLNLGKHTQLPAFLRLVAGNLNWHKRAAEQAQPPSAKERRDFRKRVVRVADRLHKIRLKAAYTKRARLYKRFNARKHDSEMQEWITGKLRQPDPGPWDLRQGLHALYGGGIPQDSDGHWPSGLPQRVFARARAIVAEYGVILPQSEGVPYFCAEWTMPSEWGVNLCIQIISARWYRMLKWCNKKDITVDTPWTIYIFCVIVKCIELCDIPDNDAERADFLRHWKGVFADFLDLPDVLDVRHGLRFAIGHLVHGRQMLTGVNPSTLIWDPTVCNVLKETCTSNFMKSSYEAPSYPRIKELAGLCNLKDRPDVFDESVEITPRFGGEDYQALTAEDVEDIINGDLDETLINDDDIEDPEEEEYGERERSKEL